MSSRLQLKRHWKITLLVTVLFPILFALGFWQLSRAAEKQQLLAVYQQQRNLPAVPLSELDAGEATPYRSVAVQGYFDKNRYWLLDNQPRNGRVGYEVVMPLITDDNVMLVNRGWIAAPSLRSELPQIETPTGTIWVKGYLYPSARNALVKHSQSDLAVDWPKRVLNLPAEVAADALSETVYPLWLRVDEDAPGALTTDWVISSVQPSKHIGYAVQWFTMATVLLVLYIIVLSKGTLKKRD